MTPRQADKAIASGKPILVEYHDGFNPPDAPFLFQVKWRDRRYVTGNYEVDGRNYEGKFERADLIPIEHA